MTRKDYILIAEALDRSSPHHIATICPIEQHKRDCVSVADALGRDNPRFDSERFLKAAGVQS